MRSIYLFPVLCLLMAGCASAVSDKEGTTHVEIPTFNADSCYSYIEVQTSFGARVPNSAAHVACGDYLVSRLKEWSGDVTEQRFDVRAFDGTILKSRNIIASFNQQARKRVMLCAHWDSRPFCDEESDAARKKEAVMGANDGASGVAVIMEIARLISTNPPEVGVDMILFDSEDYGVSEADDSFCLGSQYWSTHKHVPGYSASYGILLDMVGAPDAMFLRERVSRYFAGEAQDMIYSTAAALGYGSFFIDADGGAITDDHYYVNRLAGIPCVDIIDYRPESGFPDTWHTTHDVVENISETTLAAVGTVLLNVLYNGK